MTDADLFTALDRHGADLTRWPEALASRARAAAVADPAFARALEDARALDALMDEALAVPPTPYAYTTRIAARAAEAGRAHGESRVKRWILALGSGWAVATAAAGVFYADLLSQADPAYLTLAEIALGSANLITGN